jgi:DNA-binding HxlR family transcriptional regulator
MNKRDKKNVGKRSACPLSCSLDLVGDKWSLLIIRDMMFFEKSTYNEFLDSSESISTNILSDRLLKLTEVGLITFSGTAKRKKYALTKMGLDVKPILESFGIFGMKHFKGSKNHLEEKIKHFK